MSGEPRILLFGGTTEGRQVCEAAAGHAVSLTVCVATQYAAELLPQADNISVMIGKKDDKEIEALLVKGEFQVVIDATHPYAEQASRNIRTAAQTTGTRLLRLVRAEATDFQTMKFDSPDEIVSYLNAHDGAVLLTTGSRDLKAYCAVDGFRDRLTVRVLDAPGIRKLCEGYGFAPEKILSKKGPFTITENLRHLKQAEAMFLVTKESGRAGGYPEKLEAAAQLGVKVLALRRPEEQGKNLAEVLVEMEDIIHG